MVPVVAFVIVSWSSALPVPLTLNTALLFRMPPLSTAAPVRSISPLPVTVPVPLIVAPFTVSLPLASTVTLPAFATVEPWSIVSAPFASTSIVPAVAFVIVSWSSAFPVPLTLKAALLFRMPPLSTAAPVRLISPLPVTVPVPLIVAPFTVSLPVASTVTLPVLATVEPWSIVSAPFANTSIVPVLAFVTVSCSSALPVPLTLKAALLFRMPPLSTALPVRSISPLPVTVPAPLIVAPLTVSLPLASTVTLPAFATVEPWSIVSAPFANTSIVPVLAFVIVSWSSPFPVPLTLKAALLFRMPPLSTAAPVKSISPLPVTVPVPLIVAPLTVSLPAESIVTLPAFATVEPWSIVSVPFASTSIVPVLAFVIVSWSSALPVPLTLKAALLFRMPPLRTAPPVRSISPLLVTVPVPLIVAPLTVSLPLASTVMLPVLATVELWSIVSAPFASTSIVPVVEFVIVSWSSALPAPLTLNTALLFRMPPLSTAAPVR